MIDMSEIYETVRTSRRKVSYKVGNIIRIDVKEMQR